MHDFEFFFCICIKTVHIVTTFSTFSLENLTLLENNHVKTAASYMVLSVVCCIIGVKIGRMMAAGVYLMLAGQPVYA